MALDPGLSSAAGNDPYRDYGEPDSDQDDNGGGNPVSDIFGGNRTNDGGDSDRDRSPVEEIYTSTGGTENDMPPNNGSTNPPPRDNSGPSDNTTSSSGSDPVSNPDPDPPQTPGDPTNPYEPGAPDNPYDERYSSAFSQEVIERTQDTFDGFDMDMSGNGFGLSTVALAAVVVGVLGAIAGRETGMSQ